MSDTFTPGGAMPGTTANTAGDATSLSSTYQMTRADLNTPVNWNGIKTTIGQVVQLFENMPPNQVATWEQSLVAAGLQSPSTVGDPQARTDAFNSFLRFLAYEQQSNPNGNPSELTRSQAPNVMGPLPSTNPVSADGLLQQLIAENPGAALGKRSAGAGVRIHVDLANPLDVKQLGDTIAQKLVGRDLTPAEAVDITNAIRGQQSSSAQGELSSEQSLLAAQTGQGAGASGLVTTEAPTSAEAATTQYLTQHDQPDVAAHRLLNVFEAIKQKVETDAQGSGPRAATGPMKVV